MGKMKQIPHSDWLPERAKWAHLARSGFPALVPQEKKFCFWPYKKSFIDQACWFKMAEYWPRSVFNPPAILTEQAWSKTHTGIIVVAKIM